MLGKCTFEKEEARAPKNSYTFERFMLLKKVNNINIKVGEQKLEIPLEKKKEIVELAYKQSEIKYYQLRKVLKLPEEARFVELSYFQNKKQEELSEDDVVKKAENVKFVRLEGWHKIRVALKANDFEEKFELIKENPKLQNIIADALVRNKTDETIVKYLTDKNIDEGIIKSILNINFTKFGHLSYKAMEKIIPELEKGLTYDKAC